MVIQRYVSKVLQSNMYLIIEEQDVMMIDSSIKMSLDFDITSLTLLITHEHYDHICAVNYWKNKYKGIVMCSDICAENMNSPKKNCARYFETFSQIQSWVNDTDNIDIDNNYRCTADFILGDGEKIKWRNHIVEAIFLPGHSQGGMGYLLDGNIFFSGDNIIPGYKTELRLPGGCKDDWYEITKPALDRLDNDIIVYPGHFEPISLKEWREYNNL